MGIKEKNATLCINGELDDNCSDLLVFLCLVKKNEVVQIAIFIKLVRFPNKF